MTSPLFQACIGPSANKTHIRMSALGMEKFKYAGTLTLCERTNPARDVAGVVPYNTICHICLRHMANIIQAQRSIGNAIPICDTPDKLAQAIGVEGFN